MSVLKSERDGVVLEGGGDGYLSREDGRDGRGGAEAAADRDGGGVLVGVGDGGGSGSNNEKIFLGYNEEDSVSAFLFT